MRIFNDLHRRTGTLWEGRYKAAMIDSERYLLPCHRYIEFNPVRAALVSDAADYRWSSHRHYVHGFANPVVTPHELFGRLGADEAVRCAAYSAFCRQPIEVAQVDRIREATNRGWPLGDDGFLANVEAALGRPARPPKRGRPDGGREPDLSPRTEMLI